MSTLFHYPCRATWVSARLRGELVLHKLFAFRTTPQANSEQIKIRAQLSRTRVTVDGRVLQFTFLETYLPANILETPAFWIGKKRLSFWFGGPTKNCPYT